jgi:hypothetical protein
MLTISDWIFEELGLGLGGFDPMAFDGRFFFFSDGKNVYLYNRDLIPLNCIKLPVKITALCYDNEDDCFWAVNENRDEILKLNRRFKVVDTLAGAGAPIYGLSYFCAHDSLLAAQKGAIAEYCKHGHTRTIRAVSGKANILSIAPYYALLQESSSGQGIRIYAPGGNMHSSIEVPKNYRVKDFLFYPPENQLMALAQHTQKEVPQILRHPMPCLEICNCNYCTKEFCFKNDDCRWLISHTSCDDRWDSWGLI